jgi:F-type H+-transporting ATPase subunit delta
MAAVNSRYARAMADVVVANKLDAVTVLAELRSLAELVDSSPELRTVLQNPAVVADQKRKVLDLLVAKMGVSKIVRNFFAVLIDNRRIAALHDMIRELETELNDRTGVAVADVTSTRELSEGEKQQLLAQLETVTGRKVRARYQQDKTLLGGAKVRIGSTIYDGSVRGQLQRIREQLTSS